MSKKEWGMVIILILMSNAATLTVVHKYLTPKTQVVDVVKLLETGRKDDLQNVLAGKMTQDEFIAKYKEVSLKIATTVNAQKNPVFVKQCVLGNGFEDITPTIEASIQK